MNKAELIQEIATRSGLKVKEAEALIDAMVSATEEALARGDKVAVTGFGTFAVSERKARKGRNPQTGETIKIKAQTTVTFKPAADLKTFMGGVKK